MQTPNVPCNNNRYGFYSDPTKSVERSSKTFANKINLSLFDSKIRRICLCDPTFFMYFEICISSYLKINKKK